MNRVEQVKAKYPAFVDAAMDIEDPTKTHKYLLWIAAQLSKGHSVPDIKGTIDFFHKYNSKFQEKDIYKYEDLKTLEDLCKTMPERSKRQIREDLKEYGADTIFENDVLKVIRVDTKAAMILYGANTKWCTVSKDSIHYEEYVTNGNDFYITVFKGKSPLTSDKYCVVRKDLLSFEIFAANDANMRSFKPNEREILHDVVAAVAADKPQDNMLRVILKNKNSLSKVEGLNEWLAAQLQSTMKYLVAKVPNFEDISLLKIGNNGQALMDFIISTNAQKLSKLNSDQLKAAAEFIESWNSENLGVQEVKTRGRKPKAKLFKDGPYSIENNITVYANLGQYFSRAFLIKMRDSANYKYRNIAALHLKDLEDLKPLLADSSTNVINTVLDRLTKKQLLQVQRSEDVSNAVKVIITKKFESTLSADDVFQALLRKPSDELFRIVIEKMVRDLANSKDGMRFLFDKLSDEDKEKLVS
jgi:predicted transcriptional regulator